MPRPLYRSAGAAAAPLFSYARGAPVVAGEACGSGGNTISGLAFAGPGNYPAVYTGALFFADYSRGCIWSMPAAADGRPDPAGRTPFAVGTNSVVDLTSGPAGDLFYVEFTSGSVHRVRYFAGAQPPTAVLASDTDNGPLPLTVTFDGSGSHDPDIGDTLSYAWDLDGDGAFDDASVATPQFTYTSTGKVSVALRVTDTFNLSNTAVRAIHAATRCNSDWLFAPEGSAAGRVDTQPALAPTCIAGAMDWPALTAATGDQDFAAMRLGDCSGNWRP